MITRRIASGNGGMEAPRTLKRRLFVAAYRALQIDATDLLTELAA